MLDLQPRPEQLAVAGTTRDLAAQQLTQARDRFAAGVASNIEVVQAQEAVTVADRTVHRRAVRYEPREGRSVARSASRKTLLRRFLEAPLTMPSNLVSR